jgi:hypothetical protein
MVYWFANFPARPEWFRYDDEQFRADHGHLTELVAEIEAILGEGADGELLPRTEDEVRCRYCRYRSLCQRGAGAGLFGEIASDSLMEGSAEQEIDAELASDSEFGFEFDFEQIAERDYG